MLLMVVWQAEERIIFRRFSKYFLGQQKSFLDEYIGTSPGSAANLRMVIVYYFSGYFTPNWSR